MLVLNKESKTKEEVKNKKLLLGTVGTCGNMCAYKYKNRFFCSETRHAITINRGVYDMCVFF